jgi:hypothetical protein
VAGAPLTAGLVGGADADELVLLGALDGAD